MASAASTLHGTGGNERFNAEAATWDANPFVHSASQHAFSTLLSSFPSLHHSPPTLSILDLGCGTGLLSLLLASYAQDVTSIDAAEGMISVLRSKLTSPDAPKNVTPIAVLLEDPEDPALTPASSADGNGEGKEVGRVKFDLIVSHLVLHHIPDLKAVLSTMYGCLKPGGEVGLTDFMEFEGSRRFHPRSKMGGVERHGIHPEKMKELMLEVGFVDVDVSPKWTMKKTVERFEGEFEERGRATNSGEGEVMEFPFVLCYGKKKGG